MICLNLFEICLDFSERSEDPSTTGRVSEGPQLFQNEDNGIRTLEYKDADAIIVLIVLFPF